MRLYEFPTQPIVERLGLVGQNVSATDTAIAWELQPVRPFMLRVTMEEGLGERLLHHSRRAGGESADTTDDEPMESYLDKQENIKVGPLLVATLDEGDPRRIAEVAYEFSLRRDGSAELLTIAAAKKAIETIDPQIVIETILSREWGNWDEDARWRRGRRELVERHASALAGISPDRMPEAEQAFFTDALSRTGYQFQSLSYGTTKTLRRLCRGDDRQPEEPDRADGGDGRPLEPAPRVRRLADGRSAAVPDCSRPRTTSSGRSSRGHETSSTR